eukprot:341511-Chlamydomonas_euryale.AAC.1
MALAACPPFTSTSPHPVARAPRSWPCGRPPASLTPPSSHFAPSPPYPLHPLPHVAHSHAGHGPVAARIHYGRPGGGPDWAVCAGAGPRGAERARPRAAAPLSRPVAAGGDAPDPVEV